MKSLSIGIAAALAGLVVAAPARLDIYQELANLQKRQSGSAVGGIASLVGMINSEYSLRSRLGFFS
jgi:hypothetical protein